jgi:hypothetical protein
MKLEEEKLHGQLKGKMQAKKLKGKGIFVA